MARKRPQARAQAMEMQEKDNKAARWLAGFLVENRVPGRLPFSVEPDFGETDKWPAGLCQRRCIVAFGENKIELSVKALIVAYRGAAPADDWQGEFAIQFDGSCDQATGIAWMEHFDDKGYIDWSTLTRHS